MNLGCKDVVYFVYLGCKEVGYFAYIGCKKVVYFAYFCKMFGTTTSCTKL